jgi:predicted  nucleic acid-binding Zn-ribbon protein
MTEEAILKLQDLDLLLAEARDPRGRSRLKRMGFALQDPAPLERLRARLLESVDRRWHSHYERAMRRYGRGVTVVRDRVCQGCFITLPTSVTPAAEESLTLCESCGRILFWR